VSRLDAITLRKSEPRMIINQVGAFFEAYESDAEVLAALFNRETSVSLAGGSIVKTIAFPYHEIDSLLNNLSANGIVYELKG
jgi:DNA mismatch repair ATPase MutS